MKQLHRTIIKKQAALMRRRIPTIKGPSKQDRRTHKFDERYRPNALKGILVGMSDNKLARMMRAVAADELLFEGHVVDLSVYTSKRVMISLLDKTYYDDKIAEGVEFHPSTNTIVEQFHRN